MNLHGASTNPGSENSCAMFPDEDEGAQICHLVMMMMRIMVKTMMMIKVYDHCTITKTLMMRLTEQGKRAVLPASSLTT